MKKPTAITKRELLRRFDAQNWTGSEFSKWWLKERVKARGFPPHAIQCVRRANRKFITLILPELRKGPVTIK